MPEAAASFIELRIGEGTDAASAVPVRVALNAHETTTSEFQNANRASDFVTYRVLFRFYHFSNSEEIDLWPVFAREILPFCSGLFSGNLADAWAAAVDGDPYHKAQSQAARGKAATKIYDEYDITLVEIETGLRSTLEDIKAAAQEFYTQHFSCVGEQPLGIDLRLNWTPSYDRKNHHLPIPKIGLGITIGTQRIRCPQSFLNEAKLTQIALSIRFGATKANQQDAPLKLLVLDDLLISLDMSNRVQVINIILTDPDFADYQKIIMTHDRGFYREIRRAIGPGSDDWVFQRLHVSNGNPPTISDDPEHIDWAASLLADGRYDEAAIQLRKAAEDFLRDFVKKTYNPEKFRSLTTILEDARHQNDLFLLKKLFAVLEGWNLQAGDALERLLPPDMNDLKTDATLQPEELREHCRRRAELRNLVRDLHGRHRQTGHILEQVEHIKDRILNPAAHAGEPPLYSAEIEDALGLIRQLRDALANEGVT